MSPLAEFTEMNGSTSEVSIQSPVYVSTARAKTPVLDVKPVEFVPVSVGNEVAFFPDEKGQVILNGEPVKKLVLKKEVIGKTVFEGLTVIEAEW